MRDFIFSNIFSIAKLIISVGVVLCIFATSAKKGNNKKIKDELTKESTEIRDNYIANDKEKISKHNGGILMGFGVTAIVVGIILVIIGGLAIILLIYILFLLKGLFDGMSWLVLL